MKILNNVDYIYLWSEKKINQIPNFLEKCGI